MAQPTFPSPTPNAQLTARIRRQCDGIEATLVTLRYCLERYESCPMRMHPQLENLAALSADVDSMNRTLARAVDKLKGGGS